MPQDTGIAEIGLRAFISMEIGTTYADPADLNDGVARTGQRSVPFTIGELSGLYTNKCFHKFRHSPGHGPGGRILRLHVSIGRLYDSNAATTGMPPYWRSPQPSSSGAPTVSSSRSHPASSSDRAMS